MQAEIKACIATIIDSFETFLWPIAIFFFELLIELVRSSQYLVATWMLGSQYFATKWIYENKNSFSLEGGGDLKFKAAITKFTEALDSPIAMTLSDVDK